MLTARVAELQAQLGSSPKTPDNSSLPPSRGQKPNRPEKARRSGPRRGSLGRTGSGRALTALPDEVVTARPVRCAHCHAVLSETNQRLRGRYDKVDLPKVVPVVTRVERYARVKQFGNATNWNCLVGGDHLSTTERRDGLFAPGLEAVLGAAQQVHEPALADGHASLDEVRRQRMQARPERGAGRGRRRGRHDPCPAARALHGQAAVVLDDRPDLGQLDPLVHAHRLARQIRRERELAARALRRGVIDDAVRLRAKPPAVTLMPDLGAAGLGVRAPVLAVSRGRLGRGA